MSIVGFGLFVIGWVAGWRLGDRLACWLYAAYHDIRARVRRWRR